jgi:hypothetical protein
MVVFFNLIAKRTYPDELIKNPENLYVKKPG